MDGVHSRASVAAFEVVNAFLSSSVVVFVKQSEIYYAVNQTLKPNGVKP